MKIQFSNITKINPSIVIMPILMSLLGLSCVIAALFGNELVLNTVFYFAISLFFIIPISTLGILIPLFETDRKRAENILKRKFITLIPGIISILFIQNPEFKKILAITVGGIGACYFFIDYLKQGTNAIKILKKKNVLHSKKVINGMMATKCSRSVLYEIKKRLPGKEKLNLEKKMKNTGFKYFHLFPFSKKSLTYELLELLGIKINIL